MPTYKTAKKELLTDYLESSRDELLSSSDIVKHMEGFQVNKSTVYRNLASLEEQGDIKRITKANDNNTYYQYVGSKECRDKIHLVCTKCGQAIHAPHRFSKMIKEELEKSGFYMDVNATIFYGLCKGCR